MSITETKEQLNLNEHDIQALLKGEKVEFSIPKDTESVILNPPEDKDSTTGDNSG